MPSMKILLIAGGWSSEREVSLTGARGMQEALLKRGHAVTFFDLLENFDELLETARQHDFALINLHGSPGEDGLVQAMLDADTLPEIVSCDLVTEYNFPDTTRKRPRYQAVFSITHY